MKRPLGEIVRENILALRNAQKRTRADVARAAGCSHNQVKNIEEFDVSPTINMLEGIAKALHVEPWELLTEEVKMRAVRDGKILELIDGYMAASEDGREILEKFARRELGRNTDDTDPAK